MTINTTDFYDWQKAGKLQAFKYRKNSPNLEAIKDEVLKRFGGTNKGLFCRRTIRGGTDPSSHAFGAAWDWGYPSRKVATDVMNWLVANSQEFGVQAIHDYVGCRIWRSKRVGGKAGWKKQKPDSVGMGQAWAKWLHIETTKTLWANKTPIANRGRSASESSVLP